MKENPPKHYKNLFKNFDKEIQTFAAYNEKLQTYGHYYKELLDPPTVGDSSHETDDDDDLIEITEPSVT